jgi:hypothetical protein
MSNLVPVVVEQPAADAEQALAYGLVDEILSNRQVLPALGAVDGG